LIAPPTAPNEVNQARNKQDEYRHLEERNILRDNGKNKVSVLFR